MAKNISTVLNLVNHWSSPMQSIINQTTGFMKATEKATAITKALDKDGTKAVRNYANQMQHLHNQVKSFGSGITGTFKDITRSALTFGIGLASGLSLKSIISSAQAGQKAMAQMNSVLTSTKGAAGLTSKQLTDLAMAQSKVTTFSKGTTIGAESLLLTFTKIGKTTFPDTIRAAQNMSVAMGTNLNSSVMMLGKALNSPADGLSKLTRSGVTFTEQQQKQIKAMQATGNVAGAQKLMLQELNKEFGGSAAAQAKTWTGQITIMKNTLTGLGGSIANTVMPYATKFIQWLGTEVPKGVGVIQQFIPAVTKTISDVFKKSSPIIGSIVKDIGSIIKQLIPSFNTSTQSIGKTISVLITGGLTKFKNILDYLKDHIGLVKAALAILVGAFATFKTVSAINSVSKLAKSFIDAKKAISDAKKAIGEFSLIESMKSKFDSLRIAGMYAIDGIKKVGSGIGTGFSKGAGLIQKLGSNLLSVGRNALTATRNIGTFIARSAMTGLSKGAGLIKTLGSNMLSVGKNALTSAKNIAIMTGNVAKQGAIFIINAARSVIFKGATLAVAAAQKIAAAAQAALNFVMNMNPIIRIITVIFTLVGALVVLYNKNVWFRNKVNEIFSWFGQLPAKFKGWAHDMLDGFVQGIKDKIEAVRKGAHNIAETIKKILHFSKPDEGPLTNYETYMPDFVNGMTTGMKSTTPNIWKSTVDMTTGMSNRVKSYVNTCKPTGIAIVNQLAAGIGDSGAESNILSVVKKLTTKVISAFKDGFGIHSPSRVFFKLGDYIVQGFVNGLSNKDMGGFIKNWVGSMASMAGGAVSGNVSGWLTAALGIAGAPTSWLPALEMLASRESGNPGTLGTGNPSLVNSIGVGNEHATGLLQLLPSTYQDMMGTNAGITNPIQNAVAGIKHIMSAWKSIYNIPGLMTGVGYKGYATGTDYADKGVAQVAENGMELIVGRQFRRFKGGEKVLNNAQTKAMLGNDGSPQVSVFVTVQGNMVGNDEYAESLGEYIYKKITDARRKL